MGVKGEEKNWGDQIKEDEMGERTACMWKSAKQPKKVTWET
jgi:hypothetical protein